MQITYAQIMLDFYGAFACYCVIKNGINLCVPDNDNNSDYILMMQEVAEGDLTITPAG